LNEGLPFVFRGNAVEDEGWENQGLRVINQTTLTSFCSLFRMRDPPWKSDTHPLETDTRPV